MPYLTAVTFTPDEKETEAIQSALGNLSEIRLLPKLEPRDRAAVLDEVDVIVSRSFARTEIDPQEAARLEKTGLVQLIFAGANRVPYDVLPAGVRVASNAGAFAEPLAEHVLCMTLCLAKLILPGHHSLAEGNFAWSVFSKELSGGTCGIIGMGGNGAAIARLMKGVGMRVLGVNRTGRSAIDLDFMGTLADMDMLLKASDVVVLTVPLTRATRNMIGRRELQLMKPDAILINVARGEVVVQEALYHHLKTVPSFSAGIDTWWSEPGDPGGFTLDYPFFDLPNLVGSPHKADRVPAIMPTAVKMAAENVRDFLEGKAIRGEVDRADYIE